MGDIEQLVGAFVEELEGLIDREARARATQALAQVGGVTPARPSPPRPRAPRRPQVAPKAKSRRIVRAAPPPAPRRARRVTSSFSPSPEAPKEEQSIPVPTPAPLERAIAVSIMGKELATHERWVPERPAPPVDPEVVAAVREQVLVARAWEPGDVVVARVAGADQVVTIERASSKPGTWVVRVMETNKLFVVVTAAIARAATAKEKRLTRAAAPRPTEGP